MKQYCIGIDPGMDGAIALLGYEGKKIFWVEVWPMPTIRIVTKTAKARFRRITCHSDLVKLMREEIIIVGKRNLIGVIERVQAMPRDASVGSINYGENYGALKMLLTCFDVPFVTTRPSGWKRLLGLGKDKELSMIFFRKNIPKRFHAIVGNNHNKAEAVILAWFGMKNEAGLSYLSEL